MESCKRRKSNKGQDMISDLPDFIIAHILSLLPTKYAVRTSVLSKSWLYHWTFITKLHFEDREPLSYRIKKRQKFSNFVYRVLLHLNSSSIQSFSLAMKWNYEAIHVDQWISAVLSRRVKQICINSEGKLTLPSHSLLKYKSLEKLVLCVDSCDIRVPNFASLSSLTVLNLTGIKFIGDGSGKVELDFPVLTTYKTLNCTWSSCVKSVTLKAPLLKVVSMKNFRSQSPSNSYIVMKFCASRLTDFAYSYRGSGTIYVFDLSAAARITYANIDINSTSETVALHSKLLKQFKNVKLLEFRLSQKVLPQLTKDSMVDLPTFERLSQLNLGGVSCEILFALLLKTPNLKALTFEVLLQFDQELLNYDCVPDCLLTTLQVVKILWFSSSQHVLSFAKYVMENVVALKRMSFILDYDEWEPYDSTFEEVKEKLFSFRKCSSSAILEFPTV